MQDSPLTDSPWFWFTLFPLVGLVGLVATGGKFGDRQAEIEREGQARAAVAAGELTIHEDGAGRKTAEGVPDYSRPGETTIGIWPLAILLGILTAGSFAMLMREIALRGFHSQLSNDQTTMTNDQ